MMLLGMYHYHCLDKVACFVVDIARMKIKIS